VTAEVNVPDEAISAGWHEFRYPRTAVDEPSEAFLRGLRAAAPLILAAELERLANEMWQSFADDGEDNEDYISGVDDSVRSMRNRASQLRGDR
jgi:hypothetical protein